MLLIDYVPRPYIRGLWEKVVTKYVEIREQWLSVVEVALFVEKGEEL